MSPTDPTAVPAATDPGAHDPLAAVTAPVPDGGTDAAAADTAAAAATDAPAETRQAAATVPPSAEAADAAADAVLAADADADADVDTDADADTAQDGGDAEDDTPADATAAGAPAAPATPRLNPAECAQALKARFPALFTGAPKPVKLRIQADIQAAAPGLFAKPVLSAFLRRHTGSTAYLIALSRATHRVDLAGQPAGEVSDEHRAAALEELARRRTLVNERRAEEDAQRALADQQRRNRAGLLRDFERTTLTRPNFCALKGVAEDALDGLLEIARREAAEAPPPAPDRGRWGERGPGPRRDDPRQDGPRGAAPSRDGERRGPRGPGGPGGAGGGRPEGGRPPRR